jgi:hypothetical protein
LAAPPGSEQTAIAVEFAEELLFWTVVEHFVAARGAEDFFVATTIAAACFANLVVSVVFVAFEGGFEEAAAAGGVEGVVVGAGAEGFAVEG